MMSKVHIYLLVGLGVTVLAVIGFTMIQGAGVRDQLGARAPLGMSVRIDESRPTLEPKWYDDQLVTVGITEPRDYRISEDVSIIGGIVPHHDLFGSALAGFYEALAHRSPEVKTVIILGPNHWVPEKDEFFTTRSNWQLPDGVVFANQDVVEALIATDLAIQDDAVLAEEHSIGVSLPYIQHYLPQATVVPLLMKHMLTDAEFDELSEVLAKHVDEHTILIASVDFSHRLSERLAAERDLESIEAIRAKDYDALWSMDDEYMDSPPAVALVARAMEKKGASFELLENTNSAELQNDSTEAVTSYVVGRYVVSSR